MDQVNLGAWIDRCERMEGGVSAQSAAQIHAVLGRHGTPAPAMGDKLPPLWHWYAFPPTCSMQELGADGHPRIGDFMPPVRLNRRMWAGGNVEFHGPLHVGEALIKRTRIANVTEKTAKAGDMVVVSLDHEICGASGLAIRERQDIVYLPIPDSYRPGRAVAPMRNPDLAEDVMVSEPLLFRYSAITFNAHRIHYDRTYTQQVEHYPDLVVHGPLQANLLIDLATRRRGLAPSLFSYRGVHPLFVCDTLALAAEKTSEAEWHLSTTANGTHRCMQASAMWEI